MKTLKLLSATLAATACFSGYVLAADMYDHKSMKDDPVPAPAQWTGFYLGLGGGGGVADYGGNIDGALEVGIIVPLLTAFSDDYDNTDAFGFGTVQLGYDRELPSRFVIGVFADYDFNSSSSDASESVVSIGLLGGLLTSSTSIEMEDSWTIGGRLGYLVTPATMIYGLAGWTHSEISVDGSFTTDDLVGLATVSFSDEEELDALTVGVGVETLLRENLSLKVEYRYTDLGGFDTSTGLGLLPLVTELASLDFDTEVHTVRAVLTWRPNY